MISNTKLVGSSLIVAGAALVGVMVGRDLGPLRLELSQDQLAAVGASVGAFLALVGCGFALERSEARARTREAMLWLEWKLFRTNEKAGSKMSELLLDSPNVTASPRPVHVVGSRADCAWNGPLQ